MNKALSLVAVIVLGGCAAAQPARVDVVPTLSPAPFTETARPVSDATSPVANDPSSYDAEGAYQDQIALLEGSRPQARARVLTQRLGQERDDVEARLALAHLLMEEGHPDAAILPLRDALLLQPSRDDVAALLTRAYMMADEGDAALSLARSLVEQAEHNAQRWILLAETERKVGNLTKAKDTASHALLLDPDAHGARAILATIHSDNGNIPFARKLWRELQGKPGIEQDVVAYRLARLEMAEGNLKEALRHLNDALSVNQRLAPALNERGLIHVQMARLEQAERDFTAAMEADPDFAEAGLNLANVRIERDLPDSAVELLERADQLGVERKAYMLAGARLYALQATSSTGRERALDYLSQAKAMVSGDTLVAVERAIAKLESLPPPPEHESGEEVEKSAPSTQETPPAERADPVGIDLSGNGGDADEQRPSNSQERPMTKGEERTGNRGDPAIDPYLPSVE